MSRVGREITCDMCGTCCRLFLINLNEEEYLSDQYKTVNQEISKTEDFLEAEAHGLNFLVQNPDGSCIYLVNNACQIHQTRPQVCRDFFCKDDDPRFERMRKIILSN